MFALECGEIGFQSLNERIRENRREGIERQALRLNVFELPIRCFFVEAFGRALVTSVFNWASFWTMMLSWSCPRRPIPCLRGISAARTLAARQFLAELRQALIQPLATPRGFPAPALEILINIGFRHAVRQPGRLLGTGGRHRDIDHAAVTQSNSSRAKP